MEVIESEKYFCVGVIMRKFLEVRLHGNNHDWHAGAIIIRSPIRAILARPERLQNFLSLEIARGCYYLLESKQFKNEVA